MAANQHIECVVPKGAKQHFNKFTGDTKRNIYKLLLFLLIFDKIPYSFCDNYPLIPLHCFS